MRAARQAAAVLADRVDDLVAEWARRLDGDADQQLPEPDAARAIVAGITHVLESPTDVAAAVVSSLFTYDPELDVRVEALSALREVVVDAMRQQLPSEAVFDVLDRVNELLDALLAECVNRAHRRLEQAALLDPLTSVGNRRALEIEGRRILAAADRHGGRVSLVVVDVDGLKHLNDTIGHSAGDEALKQLAAAITSEMRDEDAIYRIGGDEFVLLLPSTSPDSAEVLLARAVASAPSFSWGIASAPEDGAVLQQLLSLADERMIRGRRVARQAPAPAPAARFGALAVLLPVVLAVLLAEGARRALGVELTSGASLFWTLVLAGAGGIGGAWALRTCAGHPTIWQNVSCSIRVATFVLLALVGGLGPLQRVLHPFGFEREQAGVEMAAPPSGPDSFYGVPRDLLVVPPTAPPAEPEVLEVASAPIEPPVLTRSVATEPARDTFVAAMAPQPLPAAQVATGASAAAAPPPAAPAPAAAPPPPAPPAARPASEEPDGRPRELPPQASRGRGHKHGHDHAPGPPAAKPEKRDQERPAKREKRDEERPAKPEKRDEERPAKPEKRDEGRPPGRRDAAAGGGRNPHGPTPPT